VGGFRDRQVGRKEKTRMSEGRENEHLFHLDPHPWFMEGATDLNRGLENRKEGERASL